MQDIEDYYSDEDNVYEDDYSESKTNNSIDRGGQFHLQSAILPVFSQLPLGTPSNYQTRMIRIISEALGCTNPDFDQLVLFSSVIMQIERSKATSIGKQQKRMALRILEQECEILSEMLNEPGLVKDIKMLIDEISFESRYMVHMDVLQKMVYTYNLLLSKRLSDSDIQEQNILSISGGRGKLSQDKTYVVFDYSEMSMLIIITRELIGWYTEEGLTITTPSILLCLSDKIQERFNIQMVSEIGSKISPKIYPSWNMTARLIKWGDTVVSDLGNSGYNIIANFESLMISEIIRKEEGGFDNGTFQNNILADIKETDERYMLYVDRLLTLVKNLSHFHIAQLHGLYRIWGHPEVDSRAGMKKVGDLLHQTKSVDATLEMICNCTFREVFLTNYHNKHGYYPPIEWKAPPNDVDDDVLRSYRYIRSRVESNLDIDTRLHIYNKRSMMFFSFSQCFNIPSGMNIASFLKDKAVSPTRSDLVEMISTTSRVTDPFKRRGVLKWLSSQPINIKKLMSFINECDTGLAKEDSTIGLYPKEREMKLEARMFALMSYKMRIYFVMTEEMLSHDILPYFPQIAMNDNFLTIQKKFVEFTQPMSLTEAEKITYIVNIDFKKWNQQMRREITIGVFTDLGDMYGHSELYNRTYDIFANSFVYLCNGTYTPLVIGNRLVPTYPLSWEGDVGGKEGLRQKGWTIVSAMDLYSICQEHKFSFKIIGGGDNQVLVITMGRGTNSNVAVHARMGKFLQDLDEKMKKRGLPLKIGETWVSSSLFAYNKYMIYKGVQLPSTLKLASRCFHLSNSDLMTIENMTRTLAVSYQTIVSKDFSCLTGWVFSRINMAHHILNIWNHHPFLCKSIPEILIGEVQLSGVRGKTLFKNELSVDEFYCMIFLFPRILGGSGTISFLSLLSRGFPDPLSEWCAYLYRMESTKDKVVHNVVKKVLMPTKRSMPSYSRLLEDPTSLSLDSAEIGSGAIRNIAKKFLSTTDRITNRGFLSFIKLSQAEEIEKLAESLCSNKTIIPREFHDIMGSTIYGYLNSIISKIDKSTTINKLGDGVDVLNLIRKTEINWINYCGYKMKSEFGMKRLICPTRTAEAWRNESWNKNIIGVTTPHPMAFLSSSLHKSCDGCDGNYIMHLNLYRTGRDEPYKNAGPCNPYLGSYTREKSLGTEMASAYGNESLVRRSIHLQKLIGWRYSHDGPMSRVIRGCLGSVTDMNPEMFSSDPRCVTGDAEHRYKDKSTKHEGVINNLYYWSSWMRTLTDSFIKHSRGGKNETLQFQTCILYINSISCIVNDGSQGTLAYFDRVKKKSMGIYHYHDICHDCIVPLESPQESMVAPKMFPPIPTNPENPYLYIKSEDFELSYSETRDLEEFNGSVITHSILESYDGITALSLLMGCRMARMLVSSRHAEERLTDSSIRMIMGKIEPTVVMNALINYIFSWKFYTIMMTGETPETSDDALRLFINSRSHVLKEYFSKILSHYHNIRPLQEWCGANDLGLSLGDIDIEPVVKEIINRLQINSVRTTMRIYKTRGESLDMREHIIRSLMSMEYIASSCSECQNFIRQYTKNNVVKWCLCPHIELRDTLTKSMLVWPEGIESLSKMVDSKSSRDQNRPIKMGYDVVTYPISSFSLLTDTKEHQVSYVEEQLPIVSGLSNLPMLASYCKKMLPILSSSDTLTCVVETYDGILETMLRKFCLIRSQISFRHLFRLSRQDYKMMVLYGHRSEKFMRIEDLLSDIDQGTMIFTEVESWEEFKIYVSSVHSRNITYVFQINVCDILRAVKWIASHSTGAYLSMARISESLCYFVLEKFYVSKLVRCYAPIGLGALCYDIREVLAHDQQQRYNTWKLSSASFRPIDPDNFVRSIFNSDSEDSLDSFSASWDVVFRTYRWCEKLSDTMGASKILYDFVILLHHIYPNIVPESVLSHKLNIRGRNRIVISPDDIDDSMSYWVNSRMTGTVDTKILDIVSKIRSDYIFMSTDNNSIYIKNKTKSRGTKRKMNSEPPQI